MKYSPITRAYAKWLFPIIDRYDWAYSNPDGSNYHRNCDNYQLEDSQFPPPKLTQTALEQQLIQRTTKLHYLTRRGSPVAFIRIDVDAHESQTDAMDAATHLQGHYLPHTYLETSPNGASLYLLLYVAPIKRVRVIELLKRLQWQVSNVLAHSGYKCTIEVDGGYSIPDKRTGRINRGHTTALPQLPNGLADLKRLTALPVCFWTAFNTICNDSVVVEADGEQVAAPAIGNSLEVYPYKPESGHGTYRHVLGTDAYDRMVKCCFDYTAMEKRLPNLPQLMTAYADLYGSDTTAGLKQRESRANDAIKQRAKTFNEALAQEAGFEHYKPRLLEAVKTYATDRTTKRRDAITDEHLAIGLYLITRISFSIHRDKRQQFSCPDTAMVGMFEALRRDGLTEAECGTNKASEIKRLLERAGLIRCEDAKWIHQPQWGVGKKWTIGSTHWRWKEFEQFRETVQVQHVGTGTEPTAAVAAEAMNHAW